MNHRQATDLPRSAAFDHGCLRSRPISYEILTRFVTLSYGAFRSLTVLTPFIIGLSSFILEQSL